MSIVRVLRSSGVIYLQSKIVSTSVRYLHSDIGQGVAHVLI